MEFPVPAPVIEDRALSARLGSLDRRLSCPLSCAQLGSLDRRLSCSFPHSQFLLHVPRGVLNAPAASILLPQTDPPPGRCPGRQFDGLVVVLQCSGNNQFVRKLGLKLWAVSRD